MTDGRVYTPEDQLEVLEDDLARAQRRFADKERARLDHRIVNEPEFEASWRRAHQQVRDLERAVAEARAALEAEDDRAA